MQPCALEAAGLYVQAATLYKPGQAARQARRGHGELEAGRSDGGQGARGLLYRPHTHSYLLYTYSTCLLHLPYLLILPTLPAKAREEEWRRQDEARFAREEEEREAMKRAQEKELEFISDNHRKQREAAEAAMKGEQAVLRAEQDRQKAPPQAFMRMR